ncbi:Uu.00g099160.m01.CDS01 [Anthostomella pinea]|uniref:Uu.00g099160.m01.CDS01 n=1 Tax=Anthostomella pinea TaxID=933095 RepID=A0AAI8VDA1_9PEZI|nr:Uu.00g099160.m01.CDS01 [Anthostomella pinea]
MAGQSLTSIVPNEIIDLVLGNFVLPDGLSCFKDQEQHKSDRPSLYNACLVSSRLYNSAFIQSVVVTIDVEGLEQYRDDFLAGEWNAGSTSIRTETLTAYEHELIREVQLPASGTISHEARSNDEEFMGLPGVLVILLLGLATHAKELVLPDSSHPSKGSNLFRHQLRQLLQNGLVREHILRLVQTIHMVRRHLVPRTHLDKTRRWHSMYGSLFSRPLLTRVTVRSDNGYWHKFLRYGPSNVKEIQLQRTDCCADGIRNIGLLCPKLETLKVVARDRHFSYYGRRVGGPHGDISDALFETMPRLRSLSF